MTIKVSGLMTAHELRDAIQNRKIGVEELVRHYLDRIEQYDGKLNAVAELDETAIAQARAMDSQPSDLPLFGLPILVKDNIDVRGLHTTAGSLALADNVAKEDAPVIANLRRNGAIILGKTNMTEFANYTTQGMPGGYSSRGGQVRHAYDRERDPSGSSTGSAVAVSAGFCAAAVGTDTSFSVVVCAMVNGVAGLKPPVGRLSAKGIIPISHTLDSAGALAKDFRDAHLLCSCMADTPFEPLTAANPNELKIAVNTANRDMVSDAQLAHYDELFGRLRGAGASFAEITQPFTPLLSDVMRCEFRHDLEEYLSSSGASRKTLAEIVDFYRADEARMPYGITYLQAALNASLSDDAYRHAMREREKLRAQVLAELREFDACVVTGPTSIMHFVGLPSLALTLGMTEDGAPRGIILYGAEERKLYSAALAIETFCGEVTPPRL